MQWRCDPQRSQGRDLACVECTASPREILRPGGLQDDVSEQARVCRSCSFGVALADVIPFGAPKAQGKRRGNAGTTRDVHLSTKVERGCLDYSGIRTEGQLRRIGAFLK